MGEPGCHIKNTPNMELFSAYEMGAVHKIKCLCQKQHKEFKTNKTAHEFS
jgi:hypothetical protein